MVNSKEYTEYFIAAVTAEGYYQTAQLIRREIKDLIEFEMKFSSPYVTNLAFACELYMKSLMLIKGTPPPKGNDGHDLSLLYAKLDDEYKASLTDKYQSALKTDSLEKEKALVEFVNQHKSIFKNYRYPYEKNTVRENNPLYLASLEALSYVLSVICSDIANKNKQEVPSNAD